MPHAPAAMFVTTQNACGLVVGGRRRAIVRLIVPFTYCFSKSPPANRHDSPTVLTALYINSRLAGYRYLMVSERISGALLDIDLCPSLRLAGRPSCWCLREASAPSIFSISRASVRRIQSSAAVFVTTLSTCPGMCSGCGRASYACHCARSITALEFQHDGSYLYI